MTTGTANNNHKLNKSESSDILYSVEIVNKDASSVNNSSSIFHFDRIFTETTSQREVNFKI
jgi:hypothetical protein